MTRKTFRLKSTSDCVCNTRCDCARYPSYTLLVNDQQGYGSGGYGLDANGKDCFGGSFLGVPMQAATMTEVVQRLESLINACRDAGDKVTVKIN